MRDKQCGDQTESEQEKEKQEANVIGTSLGNRKKELGNRRRLIYSKIFTA